METKLTQQDSLRIINEMIAEARSNFNVSNTKSMEFMGYAVSGVALLNIALIYLLPNPNYSFFVWLLMFGFSFIDRIASKKRNKNRSAYTHIERLVSTAWSIFGISNILFLIIIFTLVFITKNWIFSLAIMPGILLLVGMIQYITGIAYKTKEYKVGGCILGFGVIACLILAFTPYYGIGQFVILIICMLTGFVFPARKLNKKENKNV